METISLIVIIVFAVLNIILFFKVWGMTNNVERIANHVERIASRAISESKAQNPITQDASTSTASPISSEEGTTLTEDPNKDSEVSPAQWIVIGIVVVVLVVLFIFMTDL